MVTKEFYGTTQEGQEVFCYWLENRRGARISVIEYGCRIVNWLAADKNGQLTDIVLGCRNLAGYEKDSFFLGSFVGRYANRIENASFTLGGRVYPLEPNNGPNHNHGVWHQKVFAGQIEGSDTVAFRYTSPAGEDGFPATVEVCVRCTLTEENQLILDYTATSDAPTPINLTNHSYFNLDGEKSKSILGHQLQLWADAYTPANEVSCPYGTIESVIGTPMDFTEKHSVGAMIDQPFRQLEWARGYDHNYVVNRTEKGIAKAARLEGESSGIWLECATTQPGMQLYTANWLEDEGVAKEGFVHCPRNSLCLETQHFPCSPNREQFPNSILTPDMPLHETTIYSFGCNEKA